MKIDSVTAIPMETSPNPAGNAESAQSRAKASDGQKAVVENRQAESKLKQEDLQKELMEKPIEQANRSLKAYDRRIDRTVHDVTHTIMYTITDMKTNEVIAEYPPQKIQDMIAKMWELAGLFVDEKV
ncbi:MAG: flagellar protein FlaG [Chitinispirillaceae bacterium]